MGTDYLALALEADEKGDALAAAWLYELSLRENTDNAIAAVNVAALYVGFADPGFAHAKGLSREIRGAAEGALSRMRQRVQWEEGPFLEVRLWGQVYDETVLGAEVDPKAYGKLAMRGVGAASVFLAALTGDTHAAVSAEAFLRELKDSNTYRARHLRGLNLPKA